MEQKKILYYLSLSIGILCIAWSGIFVRLANVPGIASAFYRMFFASIAIIPLWLIFKRRTIVPRKIFLIAVLSGFWFACDISLWNTSLIISKVGISTLLANLAPLWVGVGVILLYREKPTWQYWVGTAIALVGVSVIVGITDLSAEQLSIGNLLAIIASFFYACYIITTHQVRSKIDTISFTMISMVSCTLFIFCFALIGDVSLTGFSTQSWWSLAGLGIISQLLGWLAINYALGHIPSSIASTSLLSQSVFSAIIAVPVLNQQLTVLEGIGATIVLLGIYIVNQKRRATSSDS